MHGSLAETSYTIDVIAYAVYKKNHLTVYLGYIVCQFKTKLLEVYLSSELEQGWSIIILMAKAL